MTVPSTRPAPSVAGISHLGLSVADLDAACAFWVDVLGFEVTTSAPSLRFVVHRDAHLGIGLTDHGGTVAGPFDEHRTGLDHLGIAVPDSATLQDWASRLDALGIANSGVVQTYAGHHLNFRAPDHFPVELFVISPEAVAAFGLAEADEAVARSH